MQQDFLALAEAGIGEGLHRVGREDEQAVFGNLGMDTVRARTPGGIAINFRRGLRADEAARDRAKCEVEAGFVSGHHAAAETAEVSPDAFAARAGREKL